MKAFLFVFSKKGEKVDEREFFKEGERQKHQRMAGREGGGN